MSSDPGQSSVFRGMSDKQSNREKKTGEERVRESDMWSQNKWEGSVTEVFVPQSCWMHRSQLFLDTVWVWRGKTAPQQFRLKLQTHSWTSFMAVPCVSLEFDQKGEMWINIFTWRHFNIYNVWLLCEDGVSCTMICTTPAVQSGRCWRVIAIYYTRRYSVATFLLLPTMPSISLLPFYNWDKHYSCPVPPSMWTNEACRHTVQVASY